MFKRKSASVFAEMGREKTEKKSFYEIYDRLMRKFFSPNHTQKNVISWEERRKKRCHFLQTWYHIFVTMEVVIKGGNSSILNVASPSWTRVSDCYLSFIYHPSYVVGNRCRERLNMNYVSLFLLTLFLPTCRRKFCLYTVFVSFMYCDLYFGLPNIYPFSIDYVNTRASAACTKLGVMTHLA